MNIPVNVHIKQQILKFLSFIGTFFFTSSSQNRKKSWKHVSLFFSSAKHAWAKDEFFNSVFSMCNWTNMNTRTCMFLWEDALIIGLEN